MPIMPIIMFMLCLVLSSYYACYAYSYTYYAYYHDNIMPFVTITLCISCLLLWSYYAYDYDNIMPITIGHVMPVMRIITIILCN